MYAHNFFSCEQRSLTMEESEQFTHNGSDPLAQLFTIGTEQ